jgi:hypothetical protein
MPSGQYEQIVGPVERLQKLGIDSISLSVDPDSRMEQCRVAWQDIAVTGVALPGNPAGAIEDAERKVRVQILLQHPEVILPE